MAKTAGDPLFVDTNVLVFAKIASAPMHATAVTRLLQLASNDTPLWISRQVIREYLAIVTRPQHFAAPLAAADAQTDVAEMQAIFSIAEDGPQVTQNLLGLMTGLSVSGKQIHDANIVATMMSHGIRHLLTHNVSDFTRFSRHINVNAL